MEWKKQTTCITKKDIFQFKKSQRGGLNMRKKTYFFDVSVKSECHQIFIGDQMNVMRVLCQG
jgi:hypothetical protein